MSKLPGICCHARYRQPNNQSRYMLPITGQKKRNQRVSFWLWPGCFNILSSLEILDLQMPTVNHFGEPHRFTAGHATSSRKAEPIRDRSLKNPLPEDRVPNFGVIRIIMSAKNRLSLFLTHGTCVIVATSTAKSLGDSPSPRRLDRPGLPTNSEPT